MAGSEGPFALLGRYIRAIALLLAWLATMPASAGEIDRPTYRLSVSWQFGRTSSPQPRIDLSVFSDPDLSASSIMHIPLYGQPRTHEALPLSCPEQGCSKTFLVTMFVVCALGVWGTVELIDEL
jgi:hypothetical protein